MNTWMIRGAALAVAACLALPHAVDARSTASTVVQQVSPAWVAPNGLTGGGRALIEVLERADLDGFPNGPDIADRATALADARAIEDANKLLTAAWVDYVRTIERPVAGMEYADPEAKPVIQSEDQILSAAVRTSSLAAHVAKVSEINPVYADLRRAAIAELTLTGHKPDARVLDSLARARTVVPDGRAIIVDAASANLWMIDNGRIVGTMKVITGDVDNQTPMIASAIRQATANPYWNVPADFTRETIAPRIREQGIKYLTERDYEVYASNFVGAPAIDPAMVDWAKVETGEVKVRLRRGPGEWNSMGRVKFGFANSSDIYLHDTPDKNLFAKEDRNVSHGCIRLSDAPALAAWLGRPLSEAGSAPEQALALPAAVPIYITYMTAGVEHGRLALRDDVYGRDRSAGVRAAIGR